MIIGGFEKFGDAMVTRLGLGVYDEAITWKRLTQAYRQAEKTDVLTGIVAPLDRTPVEGTRSGPMFDWTFAVYVTQVVKPGTADDRQTRLDELSQIADQVLVQLYTAESLVVGGKAYDIIIPKDATPPLDHDALRESKMFVAPMSFTVKNA